MVGIFAWILTGVGVVALVLGAMVSVPIRHPPPLTAMIDEASASDRSAMPAEERFAARDGTSLAFRRYAAASPARIAIVVHGSSAGGFAMHTLAKALKDAGVETYAPDMRGHGGSGTRGDIGYGGQLQDDLADFVATIRKIHPNLPITLIGHSSGGGFALRMAGSQIQDLFDRTVLLAPFLGYYASTTRPNSGGWAAPVLSRIIALSILRRARITCCEALPVIAFAVPPELRTLLTSVYSFRLLTDFGPSRDFRDDLTAARHPVWVYAGSEDALMKADQYQPMLGHKAKVAILAGVSHIGVTETASVVVRIARDVAAGD